ncbi:MAG: hypothetical protein NZM38_07520 [Cytophagales bacterium]|nr:hypothetical protein [Cytophagales bacterium]MDW8384607.1 hypothetical protein [Flammeovirgaceae bacterium]
MWFWKQWKSSYRFLYLFHFLILLFSIGISLYSFVQGNSNVVEWQTKGNIEAIRTPLPSFKYEFFEFQPEAESFLITEKFVPSLMIISSKKVLFSLVLYVIGMMLLITVISDLQKMGFAIGLAVFALGVATLGTELLGIFQHIHERFFLILVLITYGLSTYYFSSFRYGAPYIQRWGWYWFLSLIFSGLIYFFSSHPRPFEHLAHYNIAIPVLTNIVFQVVTAHEFLRGIIFVLTAHNNAASRYTWQHFAFISLLYFANLIYCYLYFTGQWNVSIGYLHPFVLQAINTVLGVWGFRQRAHHFGEYFSFVPTGAFLYLATALIAYSGLFYALATDNTPLIEVYEDTALYTQIGLGIAFIGYVVINFKDWLLANQQVYWYIWAPLRMPYLYSFVAGVLLIFAILAYHDFLPYNQAMAGYFNSLADEEYQQTNYKTAQQYYRTALGYDVRNHHSYYALGCVALLEQDYHAALVYFRDANLKTPSVFAYAHLAHILEQQNRWLEAIFILKEAAERCKENGELYNNLALLYTKTDVPDSTYYYFRLAAKRAHLPEIVESNSFILWTKYTLSGSLDTNYLNLTHNNYIPKASNELALYNKYSKKASLFRKDFLPDSILSTEQLCYLYNYALNPVALSDTSILNLLHFYSNIPANEEHRIFLDFARSHLAFHQGEASIAFPIMERVTESGGSGNLIYPIVFASWLLQHRQFDKAIYYFQEAYSRGDKEAKNFIVLAEKEKANTQEALWWKKHPLNFVVEQANDLILKQRQEEAIPYLEKAMRIFPYRQEVYLMLAQIYKQLKQDSKRYDILLVALKWLPLSSEVLKEYIRACLDLNYTNFAQYALEDLKKVVSPSEFDDFYAEYTKRIQQNSEWLF